MKKNGFTLVELIASFSLALVIIFFLLQITFSLKDLYTSSYIKTELLINQANITSKLYQIKGTNEVVNCGTNCFEFKLNGKNMKLEVDKANNTIVFDKKKYIYPEGTEIGEVTLHDNLNNSSIGALYDNWYLKIPITNKKAIKNYQSYENPKNKYIDYGIYIIFKKWT